MVAGYWPESPDKDGWTEVIDRPKYDGDRVEIGILAEQTPLKPEEVRVGGMLADVGRKAELSMSLTFHSSSQATSLLTYSPHSSHALQLQLSTSSYNTNISYPFPIANRSPSDSPTFPVEILPLSSHQCTTGHNLLFIHIPQPPVNNIRRQISALHQRSPLPPVPQPRLPTQYPR